LADQLIAVSERVRDDLIRFRIAPPEKIAAIPLGLDLAPFAATSRLSTQPALGEAPVVGIVGRLVPIKNHALFLEAARRLIQDGVPARFEVVGDGELRHQLEAQAADLGERITFVGWQRDLPKVYSELSVVVNTSLNEGTPVALIEAMAAGVPVVATAVGGVPDVVRPGETGWLVPTGEAEALAEAIKQALRGDQAMTTRAQEKVMRRFSKERLIADIESLYQGLLEKKKVSG
jgi:glycosyltransferase involved in cell wall biosynthesis